MTVAGVGYHVFVSPSLVEKAHAQPQDIRLYTSMVVRENAITLYGFESEEEKHLFEQMLNIRGIGPRISLALLSTLSALGLRQAIDKADLASLTTVPGLGKKGAKRIFLELQGKIDLTPEGKIPFTSTLQRDDLASALSNLGFKELDILNILQKVPPSAGTLEQRIQTALKLLNRH